MAQPLFDQIQEALSSIRARTGFKPELGIILGTGLSDLAGHIETAAEIAYTDIPHFPASTVQSHKGKLVFGYFEGKAVVAMAGRFHYYEGYSARQITFPVRVLHALGVQRLVISNAAGSVNPHIEAGDIVFVRDHINLHPENPLRGENDERLGPRFPDMLQAYDRQLNAVGLKAAAALGIRAHEGVYLGLQGPNLETPAEYRFAHIIGADLVGMSTIPEVLVARHMELPVLVMSVATNKCYPIEELTETTVDEVIAVAQGAEPKMRQILSALLPDLLPGA
ncbi:purine-nucleoside phosphorylase [Phaeodactylibacter luteus]|uniref:Purine nucleoside phosphorylase n=1 Tax=Phaeodactylibacter luteus TaxID=1564516 RepID=A0A5C6RJJ7_9BACT|nr:purine-nucleoside phosphorylase [Phaeodactylibacter luteus]TXB61860.1 purine-nucleoside phosphorylase [Phaeodactylibacter luteus]